MTANPLKPMSLSEQLRRLGTIKIRITDFASHSRRAANAKTSNPDCPKYGTDYKYFRLFQDHFLCMSCCLCSNSNYIRTTLPSGISWYQHYLVETGYYCSEGFE